MASSRAPSAAVSLECRGAVRRLTIHRPPLNILDLATIREFRVKLEESLRDEGARLVEICGSGTKAFSAGTDIRDHVPERAPEMLREFHALVRAALYAPRPTLALVRGWCLGGGLELALACDFILASAEARLGLPEIMLAAFPPFAAAILPRLITEKKALEMILTGRAISAREAVSLGLVTSVAAGRNLEKAVSNFETTILAQSPVAISVARRAARLGGRSAIEPLLRESERLYLEELLPSEDAREGVQAFLEKRPPRWKGE